MVPTSSSRTTTVRLLVIWLLPVVIIRSSLSSPSSGHNHHHHQEYRIHVKSGLYMTGCRAIWQGCTNCGSLAAWLWENGEEMEREWGKGEEMRKWREIYSLHFLILSLFPPSLSISFIKNCLILSQNIKYGTFVANVTKSLTYTLWENNSESNSLRGSSASCAGLPETIRDFY